MLLHQRCDGKRGETIPDMRHSVACQLPIGLIAGRLAGRARTPARGAQESWIRGSCAWPNRARSWRDRKSTRLNSSHVKISYAVFCLKKKKEYQNSTLTRGGTT